MNWKKMLDKAEGNIRRANTLDELKETGFGHLIGYLRSGLNDSERELNIQIRLNNLFDFYQRKWKMFYFKFEKKLLNQSLEERKELIN